MKNWTIDVKCHSPTVLFWTFMALKLLRVSIKKQYAIANKFFDLELSPRTLM